MSQTQQESLPEEFFSVSSDSESQTTVSEDDYDTESYDKTLSGLIYFIVKGFGFLTVYLIVEIIYKRGFRYGSV